MDTTNNRLVQEKSNTGTKPITSINPNDEAKVSNKKIRSIGNNDVREWDIPKLQQEKEKSPVQRQIIEEQTGN